MWFLAALYKVRLISIYSITNKVKDMWIVENWSLNDFKSNEGCEVLNYKDQKVEPKTVVIYVVLDD